MKASECPHRDEKEAPARASACEACGSEVALRVCTACGHVGCCESQEGHNTRHAEASGHPVIREMADPGFEGFLWCYRCGDYLE